MSEKKRFIKCPNCGSFNIKDLPENRHWDKCEDCGETWFKHLF